VVTASVPFRAIRALCNWLHRHGYIEENPIKLVDSPHVAKKLLPLMTLVLEGENFKDDILKQQKTPQLVGAMA
jgi:site-specific recombinase XerD